MNIYLDTNLWNILCDQNVDPSVLAKTLRIGGSSLVLGLHAYFELGKTFYRGDEAGKIRGMELFEHLKGHFEAGILCTREPADFLASEMRELNSLHTENERFMGLSDRSKVETRVKRFAAGDVDDAFKEHVEQKTANAKADRANQAKQIEQNVVLRQKLLSINADQLKAWVNVEVKSPMGIGLLKQKMQQRFPEADINEIAEYAERLIYDARGIISRAIVQADFYYAWRCANRGSARKDLVDDTYHVLSAVYCDCYATDEEKQAEYASLLLPESTKVAIYDRTQRIDEWLIRISLQ